MNGLILGDLARDRSAKGGILRGPAKVLIQERENLGSDDGNSLSTTTPEGRQRIRKDPEGGRARK